MHEYNQRVRAHNSTWYQTQVPPILLSLNTSAMHGLLCRTRSADFDALASDQFAPVPLATAAPAAVTQSQAALSPRPQLRAMCTSAI